MANKKYYHLVSALFIGVSMLSLTSCEGPMGEDANESCKQCHNNSSDISRIKAQFALSVHSKGDSWTEGTRSNCAPCHSQDGFLDILKNNTANNKYIVSASVNLSKPSPIGCNTCHSIHNAYDTTDYEIKNIESINLLIDTTKNIAVNLYNSSNLCIKCHQPRIIKQMDFANSPTTNYSSITSYRWGPHYGTVGAIFAGKGAFELGTGYNNSIHTATASCADCHMADQNGISGGHTFSVLNEKTGLINENGCKKCHESEITAKTLSRKTSTVQNEIQALIDSLGNKLNTNLGDVLEKESGIFTGYVDYYDASANTNAKYKNPSNGNLPFPSITNAQAAALANFQLVLRDKSKGVHNYRYTKVLLTNSIAGF